MAELIYKLKKDIPGVQAGTLYLQHPNAVNRYFPESSYENGKLKHDIPFHGLLMIDVSKEEWFEPVKNNYTLEDMKKAFDTGRYSFDSCMSFNDLIKILDK